MHDPEKPESISPVRVDLAIVDHEWDRFGDVLGLYYDVLYRDFGVALESDWYHPAHGSAFAVALGEDDALLGAARLLPAPGDTARQVRQVAVAPETRGRGVGRLLMHELHGLASHQGATETWLHARDTAWAFYLALGYEFDGDVFVSELTGIPHRTMRRALGLGPGDAAPR